jgi:hypothetical protein
VVGFFKAGCFGGLPFFLDEKEVLYGDDYLPRRPKDTKRPYKEFPAQPYSFFKHYIKKQLNPIL